VHLRKLSKIKTVVTLFWTTLYLSQHWNNINNCCD